MTKTVTIAATRANGDPYAHHEVIVTLVAGSAGGVVGTNVVVEQSTVKLDADGEGQITLATNDVEVTDPPESFYRFTVKDSSPTITRSIALTDDLASTVSWTLADIQVGDPVAPQRSVSSNYVTVPSAGSLTNVLSALGTSLTSISTALTGAGEDIVANSEAISDLEAADTAIDGRLDTLEATDDTLTPLIGRAEELAQAGGLEHIATAPTFAWCSPGASLGSTDHDSFAWTLPAPADFTTGSYVRFDDLVVRPYEAPGEGDQLEVFSELFSQNRDGTGVWDNWEDAVVRYWDADNNAWRHHLYFEWTEEGGSTEARGIATTGANLFELPVGVPYTIARWLEFDVDGVWRLSWYRRVWLETPTHTFDGADWVQIASTVGVDVTTIDTGVTDDWAFGYGQGRVHCRKVTVRDVGPAGTLLADLDAQDAADANDGEFTDGAGNTVTPNDDASTYTPSSGGVSLGETSTTAYRGDRGKTAYDHSQITTGNPHNLNAADVGALADDAPILNAIPTYVWAASDDTRSGAASKADDTELKFTGAANTRYAITAYVQVSGDASADVTIGLSAPTGATCSLFMDYNGGAVSTSSAVAQQSAHITTPGSGGAVGAGIIASPGVAICLRGWVQLSSTAGDVALYWGPTSNGAGTGVTRHANSHLIHTP